MCPLSWVGKVTCWVNEKLSRREENSEASLQVGESMWMLRSPRSNIRGERDEAMVRSSVRSERKEGCGLGGR